MSAEKDEQNRALERLLTDVFAREGDKVSPDPDALASIRARIADGDSPAAQRRVSDEALADGIDPDDPDRPVPSTGRSGYGWLLAVAACVVLVLAIGVVVKSVVHNQSGVVTAGSSVPSESSGTTGDGATAPTASAASTAPAPARGSTGTQSDTSPHYDVQENQPAVSVPVTTYAAGTPDIVVRTTAGTRLSWSLQAQNTTQVAAGTVVAGITGATRGVATIRTPLPAGQYLLVLTPTGGTPVTVAISVT